MSLATIETVQGTAAVDGGSGGAFSNPFTGAGSIGDWITCTFTTPNNDTSCITGIDCDKCATGVLILVGTSPANSMAERTWEFAGEAIAAGVPTLLAHHTSTNALKYSAARGTKPAGTFTVVWQGGSGTSSGVAPSITTPSLPSNAMLRASFITDADRTAPTGFTTEVHDATWNYESISRLDDAGAAGAKVVTLTGGLNATYTGGVAAYYVTAADTTAPTLTDGPNVSGVSSAGFDVGGTADEAGTAMLLVTAPGASQPADAAFDASTETASMTASTPFSIHHTGT